MANYADVEDQAVKLSVEEQMQITTIQTMEKDVDSAQSEAKRLKHDADQMVKEKGQICLRILEKQKKIASLESDSSTLTQTLELIQQEKVSLSAKITEYRNKRIGLKLMQVTQRWKSLEWSSRKMMADLV